METTMKPQCRSARRRALRAVSCVPAAIAITACQQPPAEKTADAPHPQQAGQPLNPYATAGHVAAARAALSTGNSQAAKEQIDAMAHDFSRSAHIRDPNRSVNHEAARAAVRPLAGVRSAIWLDSDNLAVMVDGQKYRSMDTIDRVCVALEPLGDTLGVVVNLRDATAKNGDEAMTLSRNCQLSEGQRALLQAKRQVDGAAPETREAFKRMQTK